MSLPACPPLVSWPLKNPEPRGDPETGFCPRYRWDVKRAQHFPLLSSEPLFSRTHPQSPLSCMPLLVQASGVITAVLVGPGTAPACPPCPCPFSCPIPRPFCPLSSAWVGVWGQLGYVGSLCLAWGCAHREPHGGQGSVGGPWPSSMPVSGLTLGPLSP